MVVKYIRRTFPSSESAGFEGAYRRAGHVLQEDSPLGYEITRGVEESEHYVVGMSLKIFRRPAGMII